MTLKIVRSAEKELSKLRQPTLNKIFNKLEALEKKSLPVGYKKLKGFSDLYRVRVGEYRIVYSFDGKEVIVLRVRHRKNVYEGL